MLYNQKYRAILIQSSLLLQICINRVLCNSSTIIHTPTIIIFQLKHIHQLGIQVFLIDNCEILCYSMLTIHV